MGHNMMLEPGWHAAAERIVGWLADQGLKEQDRASGSTPQDHNLLAWHRL
jgi:hypothetical protein